MNRLLCTALLVAGCAAPLAGQGALSIQGFGYPTGQLSPRASGTAGALGEVDAASPINPAALESAGRSLFSFQIDPEYRQVIVAGRAVNTSTVRFPVIIVGTRIGSRGFLGLSFSTLLDRTWDASFGDTVSVGGDRVASAISTTVRGAISDARVAFSWHFGERFQAGAAFHAYTGANRMSLSRTFSDTSTFGTLQQQTTLAFGGSAVSAGIVAMPVPHLALAGSMRLGGAMHTRYGDSLATRGNVPTRYGVSLSYDGIPGSVLAVRLDHEQWTRMRSLGSASLDVHDATELSAGLDIAGPKLLGSPVQLRLGARQRDLPFGWKGSAIAERTLAVGTGWTFARGWASADVSVQRAQRTGAGLSEKGMILSVGLTVRP